MWTNLKSGCREFIRDTPGDRFVNFRRRWHEQLNGPRLTVAMGGGGAVLIIGGMALVGVPSVPGLFLVFLGIALVAAPFHTPAVWLDHAEALTRRTMKRFWRRFFQP